MQKIRILVKHYLLTDQFNYNVSGNKMRKL